MSDRARRTKINKFEQYNYRRRKSGRTAPKFHDNDVRTIRVIPPQKKGQTGQVELIFADREEGVERTLKLKGCVNLRFSVDFDVLADNTSGPRNSAGQTGNVELESRNSLIKRLIRGGLTDWNVKYPPRDKTPVSYKLRKLDEFILVKIFLHGGTLELVVRDFEIKTRRIGQRA